MVDKYEEMENHFLLLINGLSSGLKNEFNHKNYWNNSKKEILIELDERNKYIWFSYHRFWIVFHKKFKISYPEIESFLCNMSKKYLNLNNYIPRYDDKFLEISGKERLNPKGFTRNMMLYNLY